MDYEGFANYSDTFDIGGLIATDHFGCSSFRASSPRGLEVSTHAESLRLLLSTFTGSEPSYTNLPGSGSRLVDLSSVFICTWGRKQDAVPIPGQGHRGTRSMWSAHGLAMEV